MQTTACPACGARVSFRSVASALCVCSYCQSTLLKDADSLKDLGKQSEVLEDFSPLRLGVTGKYQDKRFTLIGRIQMRYDNGLWNEWFCGFDDGSSCWLSDASGEYAITFDEGSLDDAPAFDTLAPLDALSFRGKKFIATDLRRARCTGAEGELPFRLTAKQSTMEVADFRCEDEFLTLDYSAGAQPKVYLGKTGGLWTLAPQGLRSLDEITTAEGHYRGKAAPFDCPSCGANISYRPGVASHVVCPSCQASVDCNGERELVFQAASKLADFEERAGLKLGASGVLKGARYEVIGILERQRVGTSPAETWMEYLLQSQGTLRWLVQFQGQWSISEPVSNWPQRSGDTALLGEQRFMQDDSYEAITTCAMGAFNWRVRAGDLVRIVEYADQTNRLAFETDAHGATCSVAKPIPASRVAAAFGADIPLAGESPGKAGLASGIMPTLRSGPLSRYDARLLSQYYAYAALFVYLFNGFSGFFVSLTLTACVVLLLWLPLWCLGADGVEDADDPNDMSDDD